MMSSHPSGGPTGPPTSRLTATTTEGHGRLWSAARRGRHIVAAQDRGHLLAAGHLVNELVHVPDLLHQRIVDLFDPHTADQPGDEGGVRVQARGRGEEALQVDAVCDGRLQSVLVVAWEPAEAPVEV